MKIGIDHDGYPYDSSIEELENWQGNDIAEVLDAVADYFNGCGYGRARRRGNVWRFATGGWSGCEEVIAHLPVLVRAMAWRSSHRGGLHIYGF